VIDNSAVRTAQIDKLGRLKADRDDARVAASLAALTEAGKSGGGLHGK
jgi:methylmalonyl-CoA mutase